MMKKILPHLFLILSLLFVTFFWYYGIFSLFGLIIDELSPLTEVLPIFLLSLTFLVLFLFFLHEIIVRRSKRKARLILAILLSLLVLVAIILVLLHPNIFFKNPAQLDKPIFVCLSLLLDLGGIILLFSKKEIPLFPLQSTEIKPWQYLLISFHALFSLFFFGDFLLGLTLKSHYFHHPLLYPLLLITLIIPILNFFYFLFANHLNKGFDIASLLLNLCSLILIISFAYQHLLLPELAQQLFPLDYMGSKGFAPLFLAILFLLSLAYSAFTLIRRLKQKDNSRSA